MNTPEKISLYSSSSLISLYHSFAFPCFIHCNHVWVNTYKTDVESVERVQKKLVRIIACLPYRAHTEFFMATNNLSSVTDINVVVYIWHLFLCTSACMLIYIIFIIFMYTIMISMPKTLDKRLICMWPMIDSAWKPIVLIYGIQSLCV